MIAAIHSPQELLVISKRPESNVNVIEQLLLDPDTDFEESIQLAISQEKQEFEVIFSYVNYELFLRCEVSFEGQVNNGDWDTQPSVEGEIDVTAIEINLSQDGEGIELGKDQVDYILNHLDINASSK